MNSDGDALAPCGIREGIVSLALLTLPREQRDRYRAEWAGECNVIARDHGWCFGLLFAIQLLLGAPRTAFVLRTNNSPAYFDVSIVTLTFAVPAVFFLIHGVATGQPELWIPHLILLVGLLLVSGSVWREDKGLFGSVVSRVGLVLIVSSSIAITAVNRFTDVANPILDGPYRVLPGTLLAQAGVVVLLVAARLGEHRRRVARVGVTLTMVGMILWSVLAFANTVLVETWFERMFHAVTLPSLLAVVLVCSIIRQKSELLTPQRRAEP